jgi:O-antigen ligase
MQRDIVRYIFKTSLVLVAGYITATFVWVTLPQDARDQFLTNVLVLVQSWESGNLAGNRAEIWSAGFSHVFDQPIFGIGLGNQVVLKDSLGMASTTHNLWLDTQLELGVLGLICISGFLIGIYFSLKHQFGVVISLKAKNIKRNIMVIYVIAMLNAFQEPSFWGAHYIIVFWFIIGLGLTYVEEEISDIDLSYKEC